MSCLDFIGGLPDTNRYLSGWRDSTVVSTKTGSRKVGKVWDLNRAV